MRRGRTHFGSAATGLTGFATVDLRRFYLRRHKRRHRLKARTTYAPLTMEDMAKLTLTADDLAAMVWSDE